MLRSEKKSAAATAEAMGGRTARVCESCLCKRARWFCAADDAFLCQACDVSVHSANQLARRHDRIRLETASFKSNDHLPPWLKGFTRKARTPRSNNKQILSTKASVFSLVPEIGNDEGLLIDDNDEDKDNQFLNHHHHHHQVPVFDPFDEENLLLTDELEDFGDGFLPSEVDLAEFVADVESLLGRQQEREEENEKRLLLKVKDEEQEELAEDCMNNHGFLGGSILDWDFKAELIEEENKVVPMATVEDEMKFFEEELKIKKKKKKNIFLRLNYDAVITAWDGQSSPYMTGNRPEFDLDDCWDEWPGWLVHQNEEKRSGEWKNDGEREARVSRYREKRRTRLFSKKIRYQVRKLNAEKRPRMKGRFVKRTTTITTPPLISTNHVTFP